LPPADIAVNDIIELKLAGHLFGQQMLNVFHYRASTTGLDNTYYASIDSFVTAWNASPMRGSFLACAPNEYTFDNIFCQRVSPSRDVYRFLGTGANGTGGAANPAVEANACITKRTGHVNNHTAGVHTNVGGTGAVHLPGIPSSGASAGLITPAYSITLDLFALDVKSSVIDANTRTWIPCLWHRNNTPQPSSDDLIDAVTKVEVRVLTRRTVGRGI